MNLHILKKYKIYGPLLFLKLFIFEVFRFVWWRVIHNSYSQNGEDLIIEKIVNKRGKGFYVDVGAYDPDRFSNTKRFYLKGWRGINIEPNPNSFLKFKNDRARDINLNIGIAKKNGYLDFFTMFPDTLSTFSKTVVRQYQAEGFELVSVTQIKVMTLSDIFRKYKAYKIDFMSVDTEGYDLTVLKSNDWVKFRPRVVILETSGLLRLEKFMLSKSYKKVYENKLNSIFVS